MAAPLDVDAVALAAIVISARVPVLIDFWAPWCPPCRVAAPIAKKVAADLAGKALVLKVNIEQQPALAAEFGVRAIPTFIVIRDREVVKQHPGLAMPGTIKRWLATKMTKSR
jgi:thioredoxin 2